MSKKKPVFIEVEEFLSEKYQFRNNIISNEIEIKEIEMKTYQAINENNIYRELQHNNFKFSLMNITALLRSDFVEKYNPFLHYFYNLPKYDSANEPDYIMELCSFLKVKEPGEFKVQFKKMLVRTIACAIVEGVFNKQALIFVQPRQNGGKSTFCRWLCPPELKDYYSENISLDKDSLISLCENLFINLDELATLSKIELNSLKSLFSKERVKVRRPYERKPQLIDRKASFIGSTNRAEFLNDETGSVRWLCFEIDEIDWSYKKKININNVWKQAYHLFQNNFEYELTGEEILKNEMRNKKFQISTPESELIQQYIVPGTKEGHDKFMTATDVQSYLQVKSGITNRLSHIRIGKSLNQLGFEKVQQYTGKYQIKGYYIDFLLPDN